MDFSIDGDESLGDPRRHRIFFQIDDNDAIEYTNLFTRTYLRLKYDDKWVYDFFKSRFEGLTRLYRSLDAIDFTIIEPSDESHDSTLDVDTAVPQQKLDVTSSLSQTSTESKKPSAVWKYFTKVSYTTATCNFCNKIIKHGANTTNMLQHLTRKHEGYLTITRRSRKRKTDSTEIPVMKKLKDVSHTQNVPRINDVFARMTSFGEGGNVSELVTTALLYFICTAKLPLSVVETEGFKVFMKTVVPLYSVPSRKTITTRINAKYEVLKEKFKDYLSNIKTCAITCDNWTDISNISYLGVTVHFLTTELTMKTICLGVVPLDNNHTTTYLYEQLSTVLTEFNITTEKITAVVTDGAPNITGAARNLVGKDKHLPCFAHVLSHLVPDTIKSFEAITATLKKVKQIVVFTRRSVVASDELKRLQERDGKEPLKFVLDVETSWNYTLTMIERFSKLQEYVYPVLAKCKNMLEIPTMDENEILTELIDTMKPIEHVITEISGSSYPTCSSMIPIIHGMRNAIIACSPRTEVVQKFQELLVKRVDDKFKDYEFNQLLGKSTILDPRFKKIDFEKHLAAAEAIQAIDKEVKKELKQKDQEKKENSVKINMKYNQKLNVWDLHDSLVQKNCKNSENTSSIDLTSELRQYLQQPVIDRCKDPFKYWNSVKSTFPTLYPIALKYLSVISSASPSERIFSLAGKIKVDDRARLTGKNLNVLLFLSCLSREEWGF